MATVSLAGHAYDVKSMIASALPAGAKVTYDEQIGAWEVSTGDVIIALEMVLSIYPSTTASIYYQVKVGTRYDGLEPVDGDNLYSLERAIVAFVIQYHTPRPTISDLVREADEASL